MEKKNNTISKMKFGVLNALNDYYFSIGLISKEDYSAMNSEIYKKSQKQYNTSA